MALFFVSLFISRYQTVHFKPERKKLFANCVTAICTVTIRFVGFHSMLKSSMFFIIHDDLNITVIFSHIVKCYIVNVNLCKQRNKRGINCLSQKNLTFPLFFLKGRVIYQKQIFQVLIFLYRLHIISTLECKDYWRPIKKVLTKSSNM